VINVVLSLVRGDVPADPPLHRVTIGDLIFFNFKEQGEALLFEKAMSHMIRSVESIGASFDIDGRSNN